MTKNNVKNNLSVVLFFPVSLTNLDLKFKTLKTNCALVPSPWSQSIYLKQIEGVYTLVEIYYTYTHILCTMTGYFYLVKLIFVENYLIFLQNKIIIIKTNKVILKYSLALIW